MKDLRICLSTRLPYIYLLINFYCNVMFSIELINFKLLTPQDIVAK